MTCYDTEFISHSLPRLLVITPIFLPAGIFPIIRLRAESVFVSFSWLLLLQLRFVPPTFLLGCLHYT